MFVFVFLISVVVVYNIVIMINKNVKIYKFSFVSAYAGSRKFSEDNAPGARLRFERKS